MTRWIDVLSLSTIPPDAMREVEAAGVALLLYNLKGAIYATAAICPHHAAWLSQGQITGAAIDCPRHMGRFDIATGRQLRGPACTGLRTYAVRVVGKRIHVEI